MRTLIFCFIFLAFSFLFAKVDVHPPENPYANKPPGWLENLSTFDSPSRCGSINIYSLDITNFWIGKIPFRLDTTEPKQYLRYVCMGFDPNEDFPNTGDIQHYRKDLYKKTAFYGSIQTIDIYNFDSETSFEKSLFKSIGHDYENILSDNKTEKYINGSKCYIYDIETNKVISRFYFFKRRRYTMLYSYWSENKDYFKQRIPERDSAINTTSINSY